MEIKRPNEDVLTSPLDQEYAAAMTSWDGGIHPRGSIEGQPNKVVPITANQILDEIRLIKQLCNKSNIDRLYALITQHVRNKDNPHDTDLTQFNTDILHLLYTEYQKRGGDASFQAFLNIIFQVYQVAGTADVWDGLDPRLLVSVRVATQFIKEHDSSLTAHEPLFKKLFPGVPVLADPSFAIHSWYGIPLTYQMDDGDVYNYVGPDGRLYTPTYPMLCADYSKGRGMIPCFSSRTNFCKHSYVMNHPYSWEWPHLDLTKDDTAPVFIPGKSSFLLRELNDAVDTEHTYTMKALSVTRDKFYSLSLYFHPACAKYIQLRLRTAQLGVTNYIHYDLTKQLCITDGTKEVMFGELEYLASGYCRIGLCFKAEYTDLLFADYVFFKSLLDTPKYRGIGQPLGYVIGGQFEEGINWSPLILTNGADITRSGGSLMVPLEDWYKVGAGTFVFEMSRPSLVHCDTPRPIFCVRNTEHISMRAVYKQYDTVYLEIFDVNGNQVWDYPSKPDTAENSTSAFGIQGPNIQVATTGNAALSRPLIAVGRKDASMICLGHDYEDNYYEGYFGSAVYYPQELTLDNLTFLAGD